MSAAKTAWLLAVLLTGASLAVWAATDRHYYTKFAVVTEVEEPLDPDDPLADAGFYDGSKRTRTVRRDEFHLGLLPTPQGLFDRHAFSVLSVSGPAWGLALLVVGLRRRRRSRGAAGEG